MYRILVVEDDEALGMGIEFALHKAGFQAKVEDCLENAREALKNDEYNLILLDNMLPDGTGFELCKELREKSDVPIIFLTACDEETNIVQGLDIGADDYITKPFRVKELISRIKAILRRTSIVHKSFMEIFVSGDITYNLMERKFTKNGLEVILTPVEHKLIEIFVQNSKQVLSRNQILDKIWDASGEFVDDNTLSVYIRRLREKIEDNPSQPEYILTVRGLGYKWNKWGNKYG